MTIFILNCFSCSFNKKGILHTIKKNVFFLNLKWVFTFFNLRNVRFNLQKGVVSLRKPMSSFHLRKILVCITSKF